MLPMRNMHNVLMCANAAKPSQATLLTGHAVSPLLQLHVTHASVPVLLYPTLSVLHGLQ